jgi:hypothetical protein
MLKNMGRQYVIRKLDPHSGSVATIAGTGVSAIRAMEGRQ